jgi:transposase
MNPADAIRRSLQPKHEPLPEDVSGLAQFFGTTKAEQTKEISRRVGVSRGTAYRWLRKEVKKGVKAIVPKPKHAKKLRNSAAQLRAKQRREELGRRFREKGANVFMQGKFRVGGSVDRSDMTRRTQFQLSEESMSEFLNRWEAGDPEALKCFGERMWYDTEFGASVELLDLDAFEIEPLES